MKGWVIAAGAALAGASAISVSGVGQAAAPCSQALCFSHMVLTDFQQPGFEPDVKVAPDGTIYSSMPFGFSTTQSFLWYSLDQGNSYQLTPGNLAGKPTSCVGGGDTDLAVDGRGELYFSDLQGLTNISVSESGDRGTTFTTNCAGVPNAPDDRMWYTLTGTLSDGDLNLYQDFDAVDSSPSIGNELVETVSHTGVDGEPQGTPPTGTTPFQPVLGTSADCTTGSLPNCVTDDEGISGNQVIDPSTGNLFISHTDSSGGQVRVAEGKVTSGTTTSATWTESPVLDASLCPDPTCINSGGTAEGVAGENFASIARDSAGYLYVTFTFAPSNGAGLTAPEAIYVVHSLEPATMSDPSTLTWSAPLKISSNQATPGTNIFPWITAGSDGRVDVAWYHTDTASTAGAGSDSTAEWTVELGQSLNANATSPTYTVSQVSEGPVKYGAICTSGLGCTTGGDRSLGDFLQVTTDSQGAALVSYVYDTSADTAGGENAGPTVISRQISGPSLLNTVPAGVTQGAGPGVPYDSVTDPAGDDYFSGGGQRIAGGDGLDILGASLTDGPAGSLVAKITLKGNPDQAFSPTVGGPDAAYILRWTLVTPGQTGNGHIFYAGMDNGDGTSSNTFFDGDTACIPLSGNPEEHCKYLTYPESHTLSGGGDTVTQDPGTGHYIITITVPGADVGNPSTGTTLYSATAFSATAAYAAGQPTAPFNEIDAATPFDHIVGGAVANTPETPAAPLLLAAGVAIAAGGAGWSRRRRSRAG